ncbi:MAG TPA: 50S ribosomal protein L29 [Nanoarchaeota archaeon]|nr:50S ribosomal protein L29 [Nanoarchaeota archaeon]
MAILRTNDIKKLGSKETAEKLEELKKELIKARTQSATGSLKINKIREIKRTVARILTLQNISGGKTKA